ncbi:MAG TPA: hypothetical protein VEK32_05700 [Thermodesulfobacteriota bacterium]|nr:hypothetical protein [Thermodesulfobacteriota bacterium]
MVIKLILKAVLMNIAVLLLISSYATITEGQEGYFNRDFKMGPSIRGEPKLLSMDIPQSWNLSANIEYWATINFDADRDSKIHRACFNFSGGSQSCVDVQAKDVTYTLHPHFRVPIHVPVGTKRIDCYAEYIRDGETQRTNTITYHIIILKKPEE